MDEEHIFTAEELTSEENPKKASGGVNKTLLGIIVFLLLIITGGGAYFLGNRIGSDTAGELLPTTSPLNTDTLGEETEDADGDEVVGMETITPTTDPSITPTTDPLVTPTVTPKVTLVPFKPNLQIDPETIEILPKATPTMGFTIDRDIQVLPRP